MKRFLIVLLLLTLFITGCTSNNGSVEEIDPSTLETQKEDKTVRFSENDIGDTIQVNKKKINWAKYDQIPNDIILINQELFPELNTVISVPNWTKYIYNDSILLNNGPDYLILTGRISSESILEDTITNTKEWKDLIDFRASTTDTFELNGYNVKINIGECSVNSRDRTQKLFVSYVLQRENEAYCILAITQENALHTTDMFFQTIHDMCETIISVDNEMPIEESIETEINN